MDERAKPCCKLTDTDGNVFVLAARVIRALKNAGQTAEAETVATRLRTCQSYDQRLQLFMEYVEVT